MRVSGLVAGIFLLLGVTAARGSTITFSGVFGADDDVVVFNYSVNNDANVEIFTTSFAGGGFQPLLALFRPDGLLLFTVDGSTDPNCGARGSDPTFGCWDASTTWFSQAGTEYTVALTQSGNDALGPTLADGFREQGNPHFTASNGPDANATFVMTGPNYRTGNWALTFQSADPTLTASIPEPLTGILCLTGLGLAAGLRRLTRNPGSKID